MGDVRFAAREGSQTTLVLMQQCCGMEDSRGKRRQTIQNYRLLMEKIMETGQVSALDVRPFDDYVDMCTLNFRQ